MPPGPLRGLAQLLEGCGSGHEMQAGDLRELIKPICASTDNGAADLAGQLDVDGWLPRGGALMRGRKGTTA